MAVLSRHRGEARYRLAKSVYRGLVLPTGRQMIEPDLMVYKADYSDLFFAEVKRVDTEDRLGEKQVRCIAMYAMLGLRTVWSRLCRKAGCMRRTGWSGWWRHVPSQTTLTDKLPRRAHRYEPSPMPILKERR